MVAAKEQSCKLALKEVLSSEFPNYYYSIDNGYSDDAVILQQSNNEWDVYNGFRNQKKDICHFDNIVDACLEVIKRLSSSDSVLKKLRNAFYDLIIVDKIA